MSVDGGFPPGARPLLARSVDLVLRFAAGRWAAAGHPDQYPEWHAEVVELVTAGGGDRAALRFAISLALARVPRGERFGARERFGTLGRPLCTALVLLVLPGLTALVLDAEVGYLGTMLAMFPPAALLVELVPFVGGLLLIAVAGRGLGRRLAIHLGPPGPYRSVLAVVGTVVPLAIGAGFTAVFVGTGRAITARLAGIVVWAVLVVVVALVARYRPDAARRARVRARLIRVVGGALATTVAVTVAGVAAAVPRSGGALSLPGWMPALLFDREGLFLAAQQVPWRQPLDTAVHPLPMLLVVTTTLALAYLPHALGWAPVHPSAVQPRTARGTAIRPDGPWTRLAAWAVVTAGGALWLFLAGGGTAMLRSLGERLQNTDDADDLPILLGGSYELRKLALAIGCAGLALALRRRGPATPIVAAIPVLWGVDLGLAQLPTADWHAVLLGLLAEAAVVVVAVIVQAAAASPGRTYGKRTPLVVAVAAAYCLPFAAAMFSPALPAARDQLIVALTVGVSAVLGAVSAHCLAQQRAWRRSHRLLIVGAVTVAAAGFALACVYDPTGWLDLLGVLGPALALLTALLAFPGRARRWWSLVVAVLPVGPVLAVGALVPSLLVDSIASPGVVYGDAGPWVPGALLFGILLGVALPTWLDRPPPSPVRRRSLPPRDDDPIPGRSVAQRRPPLGTPAAPG